MKFTDDQIRMIKSHWPDANEVEIQWFLEECKSRDLSPFRGEIGMIGRFDKEAGRKVHRTQMQIPGTRVLAERTGVYAGQDAVEFDLNAQGKPIEAKVTVYRMVGGRRCPFVGNARWDEFCPSGNADFMWKSKPFLMLGKCAEAQALAKAFPGGVENAEAMVCVEEDPEVVDFGGEEETSVIDSPPEEEQPDPAPPERGEEPQPTEMEISVEKWCGYWNRKGVGVELLRTITKKRPSEWGSDVLHRFDQVAKRLKTDAITPRAALEEEFGKLF